MSSSMSYETSVESGDDDEKLLPAGNDVMQRFADVRDYPFKA